MYHRFVVPFVPSFVQENYELKDCVVLVVTSMIRRLG